MVTGFVADRINCDNDYFMFVSGYPKFVYALNCSELLIFMFLEGKVGKKVGNTHISQDGGKYW